MKATVTREVEIEIATVELALPVRYEEEEIPNDFPFREGDTLRLTVEIDTGRIIGWPEGREEEMHLTVKDGGSYYLRDTAGQCVGERCVNYVPHGLIPGEYGDVVLFKINAAGVITNWPKSPDFDQFFCEND